ncbi:MAG: FkbM family methyltransferase, partial [Pseudomonadota bacterium]
QQTYLKQGIVLEEGDVVVDIGANIGMFSMFVAQHCKGARIFACEPSPAAFDVLQRNLSLHAAQAKALNCGVADEDREADFVFYPKSSVFSGFHADDREDGQALRQAMVNEFSQRYEGADTEAVGAHIDGLLGARLEKETYRCQLRSLSSLMKEHQIEEIGLLKVDAEKCEWDILRSIDRDDWKKIRQIVVEVHDTGRGELSAKVAKLLREQGFEITTVEEDLLKGSRLSNIYGRRETATSGPSALEQGILRNLEDWVALLKRSRATRQVPDVVMVCPPSPAARDRFSDAFHRSTEACLESALSNEEGVELVSAAEAAAAYDWGECHDPERDALGRIPYTPRFFAAMASILVRRLYSIEHAPYKVIALDCDNTLWSGVVGEKGAAGIEISRPYLALQAFMLEQKKQGVLLCLVSKNNLEDVQRVFESREDMLLRWEDLAACRINWEPKSDNLRSLAESLGLGLDSFVFLDDSPVECAEVQAHCPQALTLRLPAEAGGIPAFLNHVWAFDHARKTAEDGRRTELYQQQERRDELRREISSFAEFIDSLALDIRVAKPLADDLARIAQLTERTNQFNVAKRRYSEKELRELAE